MISREQPLENHEARHQEQSYEHGWNIPGRAESRCDIKQLEFVAAYTPRPPDNSKIATGYALLVAASATLLSRFIVSPHLSRNKMLQANGPKRPKIHTRTRDVFPRPS